MSWVTLFWHCTRRAASRTDCTAGSSKAIRTPMMAIRSEEHTSELQSQSNLVCRLLLEKKKNTANTDPAAARQSLRALACYHYLRAPPVDYLSEPFWPASRATSRELSSPEPLSRLRPDC